MRKTFKYRTYLNKQTLVKTQEIIELCRTAYNFCLKQRKDSWEQLKRSLSCYDQMKQLRDLKQIYLEYKQVPSQTLEDVAIRVDKAFKSFFQRVKQHQVPGYPRFKSKDRCKSITLRQQGWKLNKNILTVNKIGNFKIKLHRPIQGIIKTITISKNATNKWFVAFSCDNVPIKLLPKTHKEIGIDVGCKSFLTDSNGLKVENPRWYKRLQEKLKIKQQTLAKKKRGSNRRKKAKIQVARIYEKMANQRLDFQFKVANHYIKNYDIICIEKMNSFNSFRSINKSMRDVAWFQFFNILHFKAEEAGREIVEVPSHNTSQVCSQCGTLVPKTLDVRTHKCPHCNTSIDRDYNSALNILRLGASLRGSVISYPREISVV